ncbi:hypothetical protein BZG36_04423 [Bifiguratus adelaidae]|uniref:Uncharacterized protein n=1 Tax=Bifiguratus adelaidae TaxID=1938954 RepID=A0A261XWS4_9FUNG|nr:hypothetical protein BZG36_04423 [Bifiguratus adelaidae]
MSAEVQSANGQAQAQAPQNTSAISSGYHRYFKPSMPSFSKPKFGFRWNNASAPALMTPINEGLDELSDPKLANDSKPVQKPVPPQHTSSESSFRSLPPFRLSSSSLSAKAKHGAGNLTISCKNSSVDSTRESSINDIYKLSTINDSGIYLPPSPSEPGKEHWKPETPGSGGKFGLGIDAETGGIQFPDEDRLIGRKGLGSAMRKWSITGRPRGDSNSGRGYFDFFTPSQVAAAASQPPKTPVVAPSQPSAIRNTSVHTQGNRASWAGFAPEADVAQPQEITKKSTEQAVLPVQQDNEDQGTSSQDSNDPLASTFDMDEGNKERRGFRTMFGKKQSQDKDSQENAKYFVPKFKRDPSIVYA